MKLPEIGGEGIAFGVGGTNYRVATCDPEGDIGNVLVVPTPITPDEFFSQTAYQILKAADKGATWGVLGVPGPVKVAVDDQDRVTQNLRVTNIDALSREEGFDPVAEMAMADPAFGRLLDEGFTYLTVNDAEEAVQAGAKLFGTTPDTQYDVVAALALGTGIGGALARRDVRFPGQNLFHTDPGLWEVGHIPMMPGYPSRTYEAAISGTGVEDHCHTPAAELDADDPVWRDVGRGMGSLVLNFAINGGAELVVVSGGPGVRRQDSYKDEMLRQLDDFASSRNPMADKVPDVQFVPPEMADTSELLGARGAVLSHLTQRAIDQLVRSA